MTNKFITPLKYDNDSLEPNFSKESIETHYESHYKSYVKNLSKLIKNTSYDQQNMSIEEILNQLDVDEMSLVKDPIYNNAAQIRNHDLFFEQLSGEPSTLQNPDLKKMIEDKFDGKSEMKKSLKDATSKHFGAGWVWLVIEQRIQWDAPHLRILSTPNGGTFTNTAIDNHFVYPLIVIDVWEHAFYIDHKSDRKSYFESLWKSLDWSVVEQRFHQAMQQVVDYTQPFEL